jgi:hypothetical protein
MGVVVTNNTNAIPKRRKLLINPVVASFFIKYFLAFFLSSKIRDSRRHLV